MQVCNLHHARSRRYNNRRGALLVLGRRLIVERHEIVRHVTTGQSDRRHGVAQQGLRLLAQDGRLATGHATGTAVARDRRG